MPWKKTEPMNERMKFIVAQQSGAFSMTELCERFSISRKTGYKWLNRYAVEGVTGLEARSQARHNHPNAVREEVVSEILTVKSRYRNWGPKKIRDWLCLNRPTWPLPATSTVGEVLKRHGLVKARKSRVRQVPQAEPLSHCAQPNDVWSSDFKGQFRLGNGRYCYPLTVSDNCSRLLLVCKGLYAPTEEGVMPWFERAFREYGLPCAMRTDNGSPFASTALAGLTRLNIWWLKLGIKLERIQPGRPQQNGRHERMHRTLKEETAKPSKGNMSAQQRAFNRFKAEYNQERPHESLEGVPPSRRYKASYRVYPNTIAEVAYDESMTVRRVRTNGEIKWLGDKIYVSESLRGEPVGLLPIDNERWELYFAQQKLGLLDERLGRIIRL
jgi:transposase InsO family protein